MVQLGPGAPRDVLAALLNGTSYNYVMLGSASDPRSVASVLLTSRPGGPVQTAANTEIGSPTPFQQQPQTPMVSRPFPGFRGPGFATPAAQPAAAGDDSADDSDDDKDDDSDQAQPQQPVQPIQSNLGQQPSDNEDQGNQPNAGPKTPEQILQMIRDGQRPLPPGVPPNQQQQQPPEE